MAYLGQTGNGLLDNAVDRRLVIARNVINLQPSSVKSDDIQQFFQPFYSLGGPVITLQIVARALRTDQYHYGIRSGLERPQKDDFARQTGTR